MDFFLSKSDSKVVHASLNYFAIVDPGLSGGENDESDNSEQLLVYLSNDKENVDMNTKIRRIGLITGMNDFCVGFSKDSDVEDSLKYVELEDSRILLEKFEEKYNFIISITLTKIEDEGKPVSYDKSIPLKFYSNLIIEGYNEFRLHNGTITSLYQTMERDDFIDYLEKWWKVWFKNYQLELTEDGFLKQFSGFYHRSSLKLDSELKYTIDNDIYKFSEFKEFLIWNSSNYFDEFGLVYEHFKTLDNDSKTRLFKWLELTSYYGVNTDNLLSANIPKVPLTQEDERIELPNGANEFVYDPFKLVYNTITDVSKKTGITTGVNYGVKTMTDSFNVVNSYIPWGLSSKPTESEQPPEPIEPKINEAEPRFLIGKINENSVVYKNLYLKFTDENEENLHRIVVYKYEKLLILLIYKFNSNELNDLNYYDDLLIKLNKLGKIHFPKQIEILKLKKKRFHFIGIDKSSNTIKSSLPFIPKDELTEKTEEDDLKLNDLSLNKAQCQLIHKELTNLFNDLKSDNILETELKERLNITRNGWWVYNINNKDKIIFILKRSKKNASGYSSSSSLLDISVNVNDILGREAKEWVNDFFNGY